MNNSSKSKRFDERLIERLTFKTVDLVDKSKARLFWSGDQLFNMRVWSWLRMNAGGVLNTCKSNEALYLIFFGNEDFVTEWRTGE